MTMNARSRRGFTIIEIVVVMAVLTVLATMALPVAELAAKRSRERELKAALWEIRTALDHYKAAYDAKRIAAPADRSGYPRSLEELTADFFDQRTGQPIHFLRRIPADPFVSDDKTPWGLRS